MSPLEYRTYSKIFIHSINISLLECAKYSRSCRKHSEPHRQRLPFITRAFSEGGAGGVFFEGGIFLGAERDVTTMAVRRGKRPNL